MAEEPFTVPAAAYGEHSSEYLEAEKSALNLIARAEQCTKGLKQKLEKKKYRSETIQIVLDHLVKLNLLNDSRYAELWLRFRINYGAKGPRMLSERLRAKGINEQTVNAVLALLLTEETEAALLRRCLEKAKRDKKGYAKIFSENNSTDSKTIRYFLKGQGFSPEAIEGYFDEE